MINCKQYAVLESIKDAFEGENLQTQHSVLGYKVGLYIHEYKLAIKVDKLGHNDRNIDFEIQRKKSNRKKLNEENFNIFKAINEIYRNTIN